MKKSYFVCVDNANARVGFESNFVSDLYEFVVTYLRFFRGISVEKIFEEFHFAAFRGAYDFIDAQKLEEFFCCFLESDDIRLAVLNIETDDGIVKVIIKRR